MIENQLSICVLDFERPEESSKCLKSIKRFVKVDHEVVFCCNGSQNPEYAWDFYKQGLIDKLIINKFGNGGGFGTAQTINSIFNKYFLWIECDCEIRAELNNQNLSIILNALESEEYTSIDLTGGISGRGIFSGRSFIMDRQFFNSIHKTENGLIGGPGPYNHVRYIESFIQEHFEVNNLKVGHADGFLIDNGKWSIREIGDGKYKHRCDTKAFYILKSPTYITEEYPPFDKELEWPKVLKGEWINGDVPLKWKPHSFIYWKD
jgi:hypothetical protein